MSTLFKKEGWDAMCHGAVAGVLVLLLNGIGHYGFDAPEIPFVYGVAVAFAIVVTVVRLAVRPHDGSGRAA
jgi:hypothetical protein